MFDRFLRHLTAHRSTLATFGTAELDAFFEDVSNRCAPGTTTRIRYAKLVDRLCRHLVELGIRQENPGQALLRDEAWPDDEPRPLYLDPVADGRLQEWVRPVAADSAREIRNRAIVALLLGTGATAAETRGARVDHLVLDHVRPHLAIPTRGARAERKLTVPSFATPALSTWLGCAQRTGDGREPLFPAPRGEGPVNDMLLGMIVREALDAIGFRAPDMSPRVLRNTYARRHLLAGRTNGDVTALLGLSSQRTVVRLRATIGASPAGNTAATAT
ncbi:MAG: tyrosine-type recombinase/integrase [Paraburkholderia sp.]|jgi:integrase